MLDLQNNLWAIAGLAAAITGFIGLLTRGKMILLASALLTIAAAAGYFMEV